MLVLAVQCCRDFLCAGINAPVIPVVAVFIVSLLGNVAIVKAEQDYIVDHVDEIAVDAQFSLAELVSNTLQRYPDYQLIAALQQESAALEERGSRWIAGAPNISLYYKDDFVGTHTGAYEFEGAVQVPLWNWGQRDAGKHLAEQSRQSIALQVNAMKLKVAGLVRSALWDMELEKLRYKMAKKSFHLAEKLAKTVQRRVQLGDLPRADYLLVQSELLQKKTDLIHAEAQLMHARKQFFYLTQDSRMPLQVKEEQSGLKQILNTHPLLAGINAVIAQRQAKLQWLKAKGSGQSSVSIGGNSERESRAESTVDSIVFNLSVPFGGQAYLAPQLAAANRQLVQSEMDKAQLYRRLLLQVHEAEHDLEVEKVTQEIAQEMQANAQEHLKMADLSFTAGEINLMDFLKILARAEVAINNAQESAIRLQKNIAMYNQALGVVP